MRISTIVLNWNRKTLLEKCLQSYAATIDSPFQLIVIDNASSDGSPEVIGRSCTELPYLKPIFLDQNLGGEAVNQALEWAEEIWELKPAHLRFSKGKIVYEAQDNVGTSSLILGDAFRKGGIRLHNISQEDGEKFKFPDDARLSPRRRQLEAGAIPFNTPS